MKIEELIEESYKLAEKDGYHFNWNEAPKYLMLIVTEASEAMESWRDNNKKNFEVELADIIIRTLHMVAELGYSKTFVESIKKKMIKNWKRDYHHGRNVI